MQRQCSSLSQSKRDLGATSDIAYDQCSMTILEEENKVTAAASQAAVSSTSAAGQTAQLSPSSTLNSSSTLTASASTAASVVAHSGSPQTSEVVTSLAASAGKNQYLSTMISNVADRYITPEYLAPLPPTVSLDQALLCLRLSKSFLFLNAGIAGKDWQIPVAITSSDLLTDWSRPRQQQDHLGQQDQRQKQSWQSSLNCLRQHFAQHCFDGYNTSQSS